MREVIEFQYVYSYAVDGFVAMLWFLVKNVRSVICFKSKSEVWVSGENFT